jgi:ABC-2 type transport system ATP-binding protein
VLGFLGPNGAGKTTTIRMMLDLIRPPSGSIAVFGLPPSDPAVRRSIGYLPGDLRLYSSLTGRQHATYFSHIREMTGLGETERLAQVLEYDLDEPVHQLSRGNRQKLGIVLALMHQPQLLVLDEPSSGLDPLMQRSRPSWAWSSRPRPPAVRWCCRRTCCPRCSRWPIGWR